MNIGRHADRDNTTGGNRLRVHPDIQENRYNEISAVKKKRSIHVAFLSCSSQVYLRLIPVGEYNPPKKSQITIFSGTSAIFRFWRVMTSEVSN